MRIRGTDESSLAGSHDAAQNQWRAQRSPWRAPPRSPRLASKLTAISSSTHSEWEWEGASRPRRGRQRARRLRPHLLSMDKRQPRLLRARLLNRGAPPRPAVDADASSVRRTSPRTRRSPGHHHRSCCSQMAVPQPPPPRRYGRVTTSQSKLTRLSPSYEGADVAARQQTRAAARIG